MYLNLDKLNIFGGARHNEEIKFRRTGMLTGADTATIARAAQIVGRPLLDVELRKVVQAIHAAAPDQLTDAALRAVIADFKNIATSAPVPRPAVTYI